ncbi:MAG TPA: ATP-dependent zinc metalloprotease FtsH [Gemmataceae bacterium]|nr:ATP-dependent zinc metalloprotease FtsH [Gemmataceae bacterium]
MSKRGSERSGRPWFISNPLLVLLLLLLVSALWLARSETTGLLNLGYGEFKQVLKAPGVQFRDVHVSKNEIRGRIVTRDAVSGEVKSDADPPVPNELVRYIAFRTPRQGIESDADLQQLLDKYVGANYQAEEEDSLVKNIFGFLFFGVVMVGVLFLTLYVIRWLSGGQSPFSFGRSRHKLYAEKDTRTTFQDVAGIDEAVAELREVVDFLKRPQKYMALGGRIPKGVLLIGPPGTGKTLLAKAVAGEAEVPFFSLSGSDFVEMFVGVGASRVRDLFREAEAKAPCIVFIDELDALGRSRAGNTMNPHEEREQTLNALLVEMDGFDTNRGVIIMAATNRPEMLDTALLRPGRFDRHVVVDQPDINGREAILKVHAHNIKMATDVDLRKIAALTPGSVGADLANIINEAALLAARKGKAEVEMSDFNEAVERGALGLERKSRIMKADEKHRVAVHEAGHTLVACACPNSDPVHKVSIIPRGYGALGYMLRRPEDDRHIHTRTELETNIKVCLGGTIAEELVFGDFATGAMSDLEKANQIASRMVKMFGMSRLGRIFVREGEENPFLPSVFSDGVRDCSEDTAREIDLEVRQIIDTATDQVREILRRNRPALEALSARLVEKEVIEGSELKGILQNAGMVPEAPIVPVEANGTAAAHGNIVHTPGS